MQCPSEMRVKLPFCYCYYIKNESGSCLAQDCEQFNKTRHSVQYEFLFYLNYPGRDDIENDENFRTRTWMAVVIRAVARTLIEGGGGCLFIFMFCPTSFFSN